MEMESSVPPGFRFHPTEEELVGYYLNRKVNSLKIDLQVIVDIDLYRMEPWDIQDKCRSGYEEQTEWYFFSYKDKKYPTGTRTNRATAAGFWKATGRDKAVLSKNKIIGMRKTLVFYTGRAPNGRKTDWIMHEYRLQTVEHAPPHEEGWVVCRAFRKPGPSYRQGFQDWNHAYYVGNKGIFGQPSCPNVASPIHMVHLNQSPFESSEQELMSMSNHHTYLQNQLVQLPQIDGPPVSLSIATKGGADEHNSVIINRDYDDEWSSRSSQYVDWKILDDMLAPQLSEPASFTHSNREISLVSQEYDLNVQNHASHLFTCLPD